MILSTLDEDRTYCFWASPNSMILSTLGEDHTYSFWASPKRPRTIGVIWCLYSSYQCLPQLMWGISQKVSYNWSYLAANILTIHASQKWCGTPPNTYDQQDIFCVRMDDTLCWQCCLSWLTLSSRALHWSSPKEVLMTKWTRFYSYCDGSLTMKQEKCLSPINNMWD